jgi:hypothetical protein
VSQDSAPSAPYLASHGLIDKVGLLQVA